MDEKRYHEQQLERILRSSLPVAVIRQRYEAEVLDDDFTWHWALLHGASPFAFVEISARQAEELIAGRHLVLKVDNAAGRLYDTADGAFAAKYRKAYRQKMAKRAQEEEREAIWRAAAQKFGGRKGVRAAVFEVFKKGGNARYIADELGIPDALYVRRVLLSVAHDEGCDTLQDLRKKLGVKRLKVIKNPK